MNRLFVYGIFLNKGNRDRYGMTNERYTTVKDFTTFGSGYGIVQAGHVNGLGMELTGLVVDVDPEKWASIDRLERGYDRVIVVTTDKEEVYMYARREYGKA